MPRKYIIACGGTGGHLAPGIALAQKLTGGGDHCRLVISQKQVDTHQGNTQISICFHTWSRVSLESYTFNLFIILSSKVFLIPSTG